MTQHKQLPREEFPTFIEMPTRWMDNDAYGHMNNIVHYALIDTAVTDWQRNHGFFNQEHKHLEFMVVESGCRYFSEAAYPDKIAVGLRIKKIGNKKYIINPTARVHFMDVLPRPARHLVNMEGYFKIGAFHSSKSRGIHIVLISK